jgi:hypothetical protein
MPEATIEDMLAYLKRDAGRYGWDSIRAGIIATLEGYRDAKALLPDVIAHKELEAVRAFVERVEKRIAGEEAVTYFVAITQELNEMEKEKSCQEE